MMLSKPLAIYTNKLKHYKYLIDLIIHNYKRFATDQIERKSNS